MFGVGRSKLQITDPGVSEHQAIMQVFQLAITFDQLQVGELASFEVLSRRAQMAELPPARESPSDPMSKAYARTAYYLQHLLQHLMVRGFRVSTM